MQIALDLTRNGDLAGATRAIRTALVQSTEETPAPEVKRSGGNLQMPRPLHEVIGALGRLRQRVLEPGLPSDGGRRRPLQIPPGARFETRLIAAGQGHRAYKLYIPGRALAEPRSLLIMLHGCTQTPEDFAAGTRMNELAEQNGFIVAYPA